MPEQQTQQQTPQTFTPSPNLTTAFRKAYNGTGLSWITLWLNKHLLDQNTASALLTEAVEGALMATLQTIRQPGQNRVNLSPKDMPALKEAIIQRIPKASEGMKVAIAHELVYQLLNRLGEGQVIPLDDANVFMSEGFVYADVILQDAAPVDIAPASPPNAP